MKDKVGCPLSSTKGTALSAEARTDTCAQDSTTLPGLTPFLGIPKIVVDWYHEHQERVYLDNSETW